MISAAEHGIDAQHLCPGATEAVRQLQEAGYQAFIVGGSVRDLLLGKLPKDFDVATDATPEQVRQVFPRSRLIGRRFRLAHVRIRGVLVEVATFRGPANGEGGDRHEVDGRILRDNVWGNIEQDAVRRDFTINALFLDPISGDIQDFVGGYRDLLDKRLKLIGDPETRYREDPVRLLRAARFIAKLGVRPDDKTAAPIRGMASTLEQIPSARLFEEVCKLFLTGHGAQTVEALQEYGLMQALFPVLPAGTVRGTARPCALLQRAVENTDLRISEDKSVTPAFLFAALLWPAVDERVRRYVDAGQTDYQALERAGEEVIEIQVRRTAIPRRFSAVTRQIWLNQARLAKTHGKRAMRVLHQPRFRAAYDFLALRAEDEPELEEVRAFWEEAQGEVTSAPAPEEQQPARRRRRRGGRGRGRKASAAEH